MNIIIIKKIAVIRAIGSGLIAFIIAEMQINGVIHSSAESSSDKNLQKSQQFLTNHYLNHYECGRI